MSHNKTLIHRIDSVVQRVGVRLAQMPRRRFIRRLSSGVITVGATSLILKPTEAHAACTPTECYGTYDVNVCYSPWQVVAAEAGQSGVVLRKGPSFSADPVTHSDGTPVVIPVGGHFGRCSKRDGGVANGCPDPGPRPNNNGFLWGYWVGYARQGWMPYSVGGITYAVGDSGYTGTLCGPAGADFDCRYAKSACSGYNGCGGNSAGSPTCSQTYRPIVAVGTDLSDEKYYLRYAADSTTFCWLVPGDTLLRYGYKDGGTYNWSCVQVICAKYAPNGCRGWVRSDALGSPISNNTPCYPSVTCPS